MTKLRKYNEFIIIIYLTLLGIFSCFIFFQNGKNLLYADSMSRLDISRKIIDNLTPGLPQIGNVYLPLTQALMLPFIWNSYLWHSGIAGGLMSTLAFIIGGFYIYKSVRLLTRSFLASFLSLNIYALNINILYLQTTAMSESLFLCTLAATIYYLIKWEKTNDRMFLIPAAAAVSAMTLTRYEGLAVLLSSLPVVYIYTYIKTKDHLKSEGNTILYTTLASLGFLLWTGYLAAIFKDPLYWLHFYAAPQTISDGAAIYTQQKSFLAAVWQYLTSIVWMIGLIPVLMALIGMVIMLYKNIRERSLYFLVFFMPLSLFLFMVLALQRNTPIVQPDLTLENILSSGTSLQSGFNVRYGLLLLPWVAIISGYLFSIRSIFLNIAIFLVFCIQIYSYFSPQYSIIYRIPARIEPKQYGFIVNYMKHNYDGGLILISASSHEDQMFEMGYDYKQFIHEGTGKYWKESMINPSKYATWVIEDDAKPEDEVAKLIKGNPILDQDFNVVLQQESVKIFKMKAPPLIQINN